MEAHRFSCLIGMIGLFFSCVGYAQSSMQFDSVSLRFPAMKDTDPPITLTYRYKNRGKQPLTISKVVASCGCITVEHVHRPVLADSTGTLDITFNPRGYEGEIFREIQVYTSMSAERPAALLTMRGEVIPVDAWRHYPYRIGVLRARQDKVKFRVRTSSGCIGESVACVNTGKNSLRLSAEGLPAYLAFRTQPEEIGPGEEADLLFVLDTSVLPADILNRLVLSLVLEGMEGETDGRRFTVQIDFDDR